MTGRVDPEISLPVMRHSPSRHDKEYTIPRNSKKRPSTIEQTNKEKKTPLYLTILGMSVTNRHRNRPHRPGEPPLRHSTHSILTATRISLIATSGLLPCPARNFPYTHGSQSPPSSTLPIPCLVPQVTVQSKQETSMYSPYTPPPANPATYNPRYDSRQVIVAKSFPPFSVQVRSNTRVTYAPLPRPLLIPFTLHTPPFFFVQHVSKTPPGKIPSIQLFFCLQTKVPRISPLPSSSFLTFAPYSPTPLLLLRIQKFQTTIRYYSPNSISGWSY